MRRKAFRNELFTYFGLTKAQIDEIQGSWNNLIKAKLDIVYSLPPSEYDTVQAVAYWQWAASYMTLENSPHVESVAKVNPQIVGYPEISYFLDQYLL